MIGGELARAIGLNVPELVFMNLDESFSKAEGDQEIQDLLRFSVGLNLGLHFLSGAITYDPLVSVADELSASKVVLLDSILSNIDRTARNTNLLNWNRELWLIDHGASLYFHHNWNNWESHLGRTFPKISEHVLLQKATRLEEAGMQIKEMVTDQKLANIISLIPDNWLIEESDDYQPKQKRDIYTQLLKSKLDNIDSLVKEAADAR